VGVSLFTHKTHVDIIKL